MPHYNKLNEEET